MSLDVTNNFTAGEAIVASEMNANFTDVENYVNNNLPALGTANTFTGTNAFNAAVTTGSTVVVGGAFTVGTNGSGHDVVFHSETSDDNCTWDASAECLIITGTAGQLALDVAAGTVEFNGNFNVGEDGSGHDVRFYSATVGDGFHWDASDEKLIITGTDGQDALHVADGNVHIDDTLDIDGTIEAADGSSSAPTYTFSADPDTGMYRASSDVIGFVGGLSLATALPQTSTGTYATLRRFSDGRVKELTSSERFKKDITDVALSDAYKVLDARPIHYRDINDDSSAPIQAGLSAESLHDSGWTYAVTYDEDATTPKGIHYEMLVAPLIAIVKDLSTRLAAVEG